MEHFIKGFTVIDFLSYLGPGAVFLLSLQLLTQKVLEPYHSLFGEGSEFSLIIYFLLASYFCGTLLHQIGAMIEPLFVRKDMHSRYWNEDPVKDAYKKEIDAKLPESTDDKMKAGKYIFHYVQRSCRPQRLMLFYAFFSMSRTMFVTFFSVISMVVIHFAAHPENWKYCLAIGIACIICMLLYFLRWIKFEQKSIDEAYMLFTAKPQEQLPSQQ